MAEHQDRTLRDGGVLSAKAVSARVGLHRATIYRLVAQDKFPRPRQLPGRRTGWLVREVAEWEENLPVVSTKRTEGMGASHG